MLPLRAMAAHADSFGSPTWVLWFVKVSATGHLQLDFIGSQCVPMHIAANVLWISGYRYCCFFIISLLSPCQESIPAYFAVTLDQIRLLLEFVCLLLGCFWWISVDRAFTATRSEWQSCCIYLFLGLNRETFGDCFQKFTSDFFVSDLKWNLALMPLRRRPQAAYLPSFGTRTTTKKIGSSVCITDSEKIRHTGRQTYEFD